MTKGSIEKRIKEIRKSVDTKGNEAQSKIKKDISGTKKTRFTKNENEKTDD